MSSWFKRLLWGLGFGVCTKGLRPARVKGCRMRGVRELGGFLSRSGEFFRC